MTAVSSLPPATPSVAISDRELQWAAANLWRSEGLIAKLPPCPEKDALAAHVASFHAGAAKILASRATFKASTDITADDLLDTSMVIVNTDSYALLSGGTPKNNPGPGNGG